jgi:UDP-N-acetylglucosamine--dolichyl-phosphate N-acetylglucosaminephosphotransferase
VLWFLPQAINFGYSLLQLSGWIECPRHRMPKNGDGNVLVFSTVTIKNATPSQTFLLDTLRRCKLVYVEKVGQSIIVNNMTLMNWILLFFGPMHEAELCACLLVLQAMWCVIGMCIRHPLAKFFYSI